MNQTEKLKFIQNKAKKLGLKGTIKKSDTKTKKYDYIENNKKVSFGAVGYSDYLENQDKKRRDRYRERHKEIKLKSGKRAIDVKGSPAYLSYNLLW